MLIGGSWSKGQLSSPRMRWSKLVAEHAVLVLEHLLSTELGFFFSFLLERHQIRCKCWVQSKLQCGAVMISSPVLWVLSVSETWWRLIGLRCKATLCHSKEQRKTAFAHKAVFCETFPSFLIMSWYTVLLPGSEKSVVFPLQCRTSHLNCCHL